MIEMDKLVRDLIPQIIADTGKLVIVRKLEGEELADALMDKLEEEFDEFEETPNVEEMVDILTVLTALARHYELDIDEIQRVMKEKAEQKGTFEMGYFIEVILEKGEF